VEVGRAVADLPDLADVHARWFSLSVLKTSSAVESGARMSSDRTGPI
jgi:hypothetical protein